MDIGRLSITFTKRFKLTRRNTVLIILDTSKLISKQSCKFAMVLFYNGAIAKWCFDFMMEWCNGEIVNDYYDGKVKW